MKRTFALALILQISTVYARSVAEGEGDGKGITCSYKGVEYKEGEKLPTEGQCFKCVCQEGFVEPSTDTCAIIDCPRPWNELCQPVYDENECCPVSLNCSASNAAAEASKCQCEPRFFKHYDVKECKPIYEEGCDCPVRFDCPETFPKDKTVCHHEGKTYQVGEKINAGACRICECEKSHDADAVVKINCISIECPSMFGFDPRLQQPDCYDVYKEDSCCSVDVKCDDGTPNVTEPMCELEGKVYHVGQQMYPKSNPCVTCYCDEKWTGIDGGSCKTVDCLIEENIEQLQRGCIPIYHETACCPIEFHCKNGAEEVIPTVKASTFPSDEKADGKNKCLFDGKSYNVGDVLDIKHPTNCVNCSCMTPPDFTCIHKVCPHPPNDDYENCHSIYTPGQCCATYNCVQKAPSFMCSPVSCPETCTEMWVSDGCPMCMCNDVLCSEPECPANCTIDYDASPCPTCKCPETIPLKKPVCDPVKCGMHCTEGISPQGCPICVCGPLCSPPKCEAGCEVQTHVIEGQCPGCVCHDDPTNHVARILCSPVKCPSDCRETTGQNGCPMCDCDPTCSPPKCELGCHLEHIPSAGPCPGCVCDADIPQTVLCAPVKCGEGCTEVIVPNGCPMCMCTDLLCLPPICPPGCEVVFAIGSCPDCKCPSTMELEMDHICDPVKCAPQCHEAIGPQGCVTCVCGPLCSPPKCNPGCRVQTRVPEGQCPGCDCPPDDSTSAIDARRIQCAPVKCARLCREAIGRNGCPTCVCGPSCSAPRCDHGCRVQRTSPNAPCPECVCDKLTKVPDFLCATVKCPEMCSEAADEHGCPTCMCDPQCSVPKCGRGCQLKLTSGPCPECVCDNHRSLAFVACSQPRCEPCEIDFTMKPCPGCRCTGRVPLIQCSPPRCDPDCEIDYSTKPCPSCTCDGNQVPLLQCTPPKCDDGCRLDYSTKPCPSCTCDGGGVLPIQCMPPKCDDPGCHLDFSTKPCPSCKCDGERVLCSPPMCAPYCRMDYDTKPCPSCICDDEVPSVQCSPPRCDAGCYLDYGTIPCPSCKCDRQGALIPCSPPKCDEPGCHIDDSTKPCPSCKCLTKRDTSVQCSLPRCRPSCRLDYNTKPCPSCNCGTRPVLPPDVSIQCSPPRCDPDCLLDYSTKPCPSCNCDTPPVLPPDLSIQCSPPRCGPDCRLDYSPKLCPICTCDIRSGPSIPIPCSPPKCGRGCSINYSTSPCPSCSCRNKRSTPYIACSPPRCGPGCQLNYNTRPCPSCSCYGRHGDPN